MYQEIFRDNELVFKASFKLAFLKNYKPSKIPMELLKIFN